MVRAKKRSEIANRRKGHAGLVLTTRLSNSRRSRRGREEANATDRRGKPPPLASRRKRRVGLVWLDRWSSSPKPRRGREAANVTVPGVKRLSLATAPGR